MKSDNQVLNISDTLIERDKSARLRMLWEELTFSSLENGTEGSKFGDCTQEECKIECDNKCGHLCEIFFSCAEGRKEDLGRTLQYCSTAALQHTALISPQLQTSRPAACES